MFRLLTLSSIDGGCGHEQNVTLCSFVALLYNSGNTGRLSRE